MATRARPSPAGWRPGPAPQGLFGVFGFRDLGFREKDLGCFGGFEGFG